MAKKVERLSKDYLEKKLESLKEQQNKVEDLIQQYSEVWQQLSGAVQLITDMLNDIKEELINKDENV
jgi:uncharacterized protein involved in exopolysaccharide biosynthesis